MPKRTPEDFTAEVEAHVALEADRLIGEGMSPADARAAALETFGSPTRVRERFYEKSRWMWLEQFVQDLRYAWRGLRDQPSFLITTVLTLAVGLSVVTVAFTVFNAYVLRPFAIRDPRTLYNIGWRAGDDGGHQFRWEGYTAIRERSDLFDGVIADHSRYVNSEGRTIEAAFVSGNYFDVLAPRVVMGRALAPVDDGQPVAVLSELGWTRLFAKDPAVIGRQLDVDGAPFTVIGVTHPEFTGIDDTPRDLWIPLSTRMQRFNPERRIEVSARLRPGVGPAQAQAALTAVMTGLLEPRKDGKAIRADLESQATPNPLSLGMIAVLSPVFAAFGLVLVTACANVSNVMLSRAITRHREIAVRLSLGASRWRIVRQLTTEGLLVSLLAGGAGLLVASWTLRAGIFGFYRTLPPSIVQLIRVTPLDFDYRVFVFALVVASGTTLIVAVMPALQASRAPLTDALRGQRSGTLRGSKLRAALVIAQVAVSLVLVVSALTLARNGSSLSRLDTGLDDRGVLSINIRGEGSDDRLIARLAPLLESDPRVAEIAVTNGNPFFVGRRDAALAPEGVKTAVPTRYTFVSPNYFSMLRIPIVAGRGFDERESATSAAVAIVSAATARRFWPGGDAIGRTIRVERPTGPRIEELPGYTALTVVGVAGDVMSGVPVDGRDDSNVYLPTRAGSPHATAILLRPREDRGLGAAALQDLFRRVSNDTELFETLPLDEVRQTMVYPIWISSWIGVILSGLAVALSISGLYGVLSYTLAQRTREIGIRMALGATAGAVMTLVMRQCGRLAGVGMAAGLIVVFGVLKALGAVVQLREITLLDMTAFAGGAAVVCVAAALAAYRPAQRATRIDPAETLRAEA